MKMYLVVECWRVDYDVYMQEHLYGTMELAKKKLQELKEQYKKDWNINNFNYIEDTDTTFLVYDEGWYDKDNIDICIKELNVNEN